MAYYQQPEEEKSASFNDALNHISRIDICLRQIHQSKVNPFQMDINYGVQNYQVRISSLSSFWQEIKPFCDDKERKLIERIFNIVHFYSGELIVSDGENNILDQEKFFLFDKFADFLESKLRDLQFSKGLSNPLKEREFVI